MTPAAKTDATAASTGECGLGGGVCIIYRSADGQTTVVDGGAKSRAATTPATISRIPDGIDSTLGAGHRTVAVPGTVAALAELLARYGTVRLARAVASAEQLAREGFPVGPDLAFHLGVRALPAPALRADCRHLSPP